MFCQIPVLELNMNDLEILFKKVDDYKLTDREIYIGRFWALFICHFENFKEEILNIFSQKLLESRFQNAVFHTFKKHKLLELKSYLDDDYDFYKYKIQDLEHQLESICCF